MHTQQTYASFGPRISRCCVSNADMQAKYVRISLFSAMDDYTCQTEDTMQATIM